jgi:hypothetical protein
MERYNPLIICMMFLGLAIYAFYREVYIVTIVCSGIAMYFARRTNETFNSPK